MIKSLILFITGLLLLYKGGDFFVDSAVEIARRRRIPEMIIGATIVSIGTTIPEVTVSALASGAGEADIAYGNAIGSVICNTALIAGILLCLSPTLVRRRALASGALFLALSCVVFFIFAYTFGVINWSTGLFLLGVFLVYILYSAHSAAKAPREAPSPPQHAGATAAPLWRSLAKLAVSAAAIFFGSNLLVNNGVLIAGALGVPDQIIALTFIALGTSLPELVTAISAALKRHSAISLGNIIGANFFNLTLVSGLSAVISPTFMPSHQVIPDFLTAALVMLLLTVPALVFGKTSRLQGAALLAAYALYIMFLFSGALRPDAVTTFAPYIIS